MAREAFLQLLSDRLTTAGVPVRRWTVQPGLEDLELQVGGEPVQLRVVRTGPKPAEG